MHPLDTLTAGYVLGLLLRPLPEAGGWPEAAGAAAFSIGLAALAWALRRRSATAGGGRRAALALLLAAAGVWGAVAVPAFQRWRLPPHHLLRNMPRGRVNLIGHLTRPVERRAGRRRPQPRLTIAAERAIVRGVEVPLTGTARIRLASPLRQRLEVGDRVLVRRVRLLRPLRYQNPGGFDYREFLRLREVHAVGFTSARSVERLAPRERGLWRRVLFRFRDRMRAHLRGALSPEAASLLEAMTLGVREDLGRRTKADFQSAGAAHLLAISGLHVGFITAFFFFLLRALFRRLPPRLFPLRPIVLTPDKAAALTVIPIVILFTLVTGARISTVRAAIMVVAYLLGRVLERPGAALHSVMLAALFILFAEPGFVWDAGFQLSFVAVAAIVVAARRLPRPGPRRGLWDPARWRVRLVQFAIVQVVVAAAVTPLTAYHFNQAHPVGLAANFALIPVASAAVPLTFLTGALAAGLEALSPAWAALLLGPADAALELLARLMLALTRLASGLPGATVVVPPPHPALVAGALACLALALGARRAAWRRLGWALTAGGLALMLLPASPAPAPTGRVTLLLPDAGRTDAFFLRLPGGRGIAVDGSGKAAGGFNPWTSVIAPLLLRQGEGGWDLLWTFSRKKGPLAAAALGGSVRIGRVASPFSLTGNRLTGNPAGRLPGALSPAAFQRPRGRPRRRRAGAGEALWAIEDGGARLALRRWPGGRMAFELRFGRARWLLVMAGGRRGSRFDPAPFSGKGYDLVRLPGRLLRRPGVLGWLERDRPRLVVASPHRGRRLRRDRWRRVRRRQEALGVYRPWRSGMMRVRTAGRPVGRGARVERFAAAGSWPDTRRGRWLAFRTGPREGARAPARFPRNGLQSERERP